MRTFNRLGLFNPAFDEGAISTIQQISALTNLNASLESASRSYLDANCAQCHQPGGTGITFDSRYTTPSRIRTSSTAGGIHLGYDKRRCVGTSDIWRSALYTA